MARAKNNPAAADQAADTQASSTSASASAALVDREGGADAAASGGGASDQVVDIVAGNAADVGGPPTIIGVDPASGPDQTVVFVQRDGAAGEISTAEPSASSAPQVSDLVSAADQSDAALDLTADDETFEGSSILPAVMVLPLDVSITLGELVVWAARERGCDAAAWNAVDTITRERWLSSALDDLAYDIRTPHQVHDALMIEAVSRDGQPYIRCGVTWTSDPQEVLVHPLVAKRLKSDPFIAVKAERLASED